MRWLVLLAILAGCPDQEPIGTTEWVTTASPGAVRVSSSGRIIEVRPEFVRARDSDGTLLWEQSVGYNDTFDVDSAGNVYVGRAEGMAGRRLYALSAENGAPLWSVGFGVGNIQLRVVVGADDVVWCFRGEPGVTRWSQYRTSGEEIATGTLSFSVESGVALPDGGLLVNGAGLTTLDQAGTTTWQGERVQMFALHDDGEISAHTGTELIRFTADRQVRWRRRFDGGSALHAVGDRLLIGSYTQVGTELELFDRDGGSTALERFSAQVNLEPAGRGDVYFLTYFGTRSVDLHDRVIPFEDVPVGVFLSGLVARRL